jgi:hypothetical protein
LPEHCLLLRQIFDVLYECFALLPQPIDLVPLLFRLEQHLVERLLRSRKLSLQGMK